VTVSQSKEDEMLMLLASVHHHGWHWFWPLVPLAWLLVFFVLARFVFWRGPNWRHAGPDARAILAERYARGEISLEEYRERLGNLER
jgi:putative membrane protein